MLIVAILIKVTPFSVVRGLSAVERVERSSECVRQQRVNSSVRIVCSSLCRSSFRSMWQRCSHGPSNSVPIPDKLCAQFHIYHEQSVIN